jgi:GDPmannose 4,6-dehydratase
MNKKNKVAIVTGVNGQDGSYLAELLLDKGYKVIGTTRYTSSSEASREERISHIKHKEGFILESCDVTDFSRVNSLVTQHGPDEIYNLAAQSHVGISYKNPISTTNINIMGPINFLESIRNNDKNIKFYQASTSEMFGVNEKCPQNEDTLMMPISPYAAAKLYAHNMVKIYRDSYGIFACSGILFNHESERRGEEFVTRKITKAAARIKLGKQEKLHLGNLKAYRDWGHARDYVEAMFLMLQQSKPEDFVISTGETHTVEEFLRFVFDYAQLDLEKHLVIDRELFRPSEVPKLWGNYTKAKEKLGWEPKIKFEELAIKMYENDLHIENMEKLK